MRLIGKRTRIERVYAIGDIHGRLDLFDRLIAMIDRDQAVRGTVPTRLILLGDLVDRGPDSAGLIRGCMTFAGRSDRFVVLKGNHEAMMVEALRGNVPVFMHWMEFGGRETLTSWGVDSRMIDRGPDLDLLQTARKAVGEDTLRWLASLPLTHRHGDYLFVHAGIRPGRKLSRQTEDDLLWITDEFLQSTEEHGCTVVHGHSIHEAGADIRPNRIGIDTGAYRTGRLTALGIEGGERWTLMTEPTPGTVLRRSREPITAVNDIYAPTAREG